jgi:hypothetical protein
MRRSCCFITAFGMIALCVALSGCGTKQPPSGGAGNPRAEKARKDAEAMAINGVTSGANAQAKFVPVEEKAKVTPVGVTKGQAEQVPITRPGGVVVVIQKPVRSAVPSTNEAEADEDAIAQACEVIERELAKLDPPVHYKPSPNEAKGFIRKESRTVRAPDAAEKQLLTEIKFTGNPVYVEYEVEITADQVRELRSQDRVSTGVRVLGALMAVALAAFLFLRADEWTKGYLTSWLALGAIALAGGAAAALVFI